MDVKAVAAKNKFHITFAAGSSFSRSIFTFKIITQFSYFIFKTKNPSPLAQSFRKTLVIYTIALLTTAQLLAFNRQSTFPSSEYCLRSKLEGG